MSIDKINRAFARHYHESLITYINLESGSYHYGKMKDNSVGGMSFSSDTELQPGSEILIKMEYFSPSINNQDTKNSCLAKVVWCSENSNGQEIIYNNNFDIGVKYDEILV